MGGEHGGGAMVCVTGGSGFIGSWLVMMLLERGYYVRATIRDPGDVKRVRHLLDLPNAGTHLSLWKADLTEEGSFDDAIQGCTGVFHVASPIDFSGNNPEDEIIKPTVNGVLSIMRSFCKAKTVKRIIYTSTAGTVAVQQHPQSEYNESCWTDVDFCRTEKMLGWSYLVAKTTAEKEAWEFAKENGIDLITVHPSIVIGPFITSWPPLSIEVATALITKNEALYGMIRGCAVHLEDVCNAHIYLLEHPKAQGRYICSSHCVTIFDLAESLRRKYPEYNIPTKFEGIDETTKAVPCSSKKLLELGFRFKYNPDEYDVGDLCAEAVECLKEKGLLPPPV